MQESNNGPLCEFRWQVKTFTRPIAKVTGQTISLYVIAVSSVSQDFEVHNICTKRSSPGKHLLSGGLVSKASGDFVLEVWDRNVGV